MCDDYKFGCERHCGWAGWGWSIRFLVKTIVWLCLGYTYGRLSDALAAKSSVGAHERS